MRAENITGPVAHHGEGPVWWDQWGGLRFLDVHAGDILSLTPNGIERMHTFEDSVSFIRPRTNGGYVIGTSTGLAFANSAKELPTHNITLVEGGNQQMNDGGTTPDGELLAGSMTADGEPSGFLFQLSSNHALHQIEEGISCSNGIAFSPDGSLAYYVDTPTGRIDAFDYEHKTLANRRPFVTIATELGLPDGITVDADGNVWVALWGGHQVRAYDKHGVHVETVEVSVGQVSACAFGDDNLGTLFITTSRQGIPDGLDPQAGSLFSVQPGVIGLPVVPFRG